MFFISAHWGLRKEMDQIGIFFSATFFIAAFILAGSENSAEMAAVFSYLRRFRVTCVIMPVVPMVPIILSSSFPDISFTSPFGRTTLADSIVSWAQPYS